MMAGMVAQDVLANPAMRLIVEKGQDKFKVLLHDLWFCSVMDPLRE
jgi:hypothetical protein